MALLGTKEWKSKFVRVHQRGCTTGSRETNSCGFSGNDVCTWVCGGNGILEGVIDHGHLRDCTPEP
jgi:hypothetical protein